MAEVVAQRRRRQEEPRSSPPELAADFKALLLEPSDRVLCLQVTWCSSEPTSTSSSPFVWPWQRRHLLERVDQRSAQFGVRRCEQRRDAIPSGRVVRGEPVIPVLVIGSVGLAAGGSRGEHLRRWVIATAAPSVLRTTSPESSPSFSVIDCAMVDELQVELEPRRRARHHADGAPEEAVVSRRARGRGVVLLRVLSTLLIEGPPCSAAAICGSWRVGAGAGAGVFRLQERKRGREGGGAHATCETRARLRSGGGGGLWRGPDVRFLPSFAAAASTAAAAASADLLFTAALRPREISAEGERASAPAAAAAREPVVPRRPARGRSPSATEALRSSRRHRKRRQAAATAPAPEGSRWSRASATRSAHPSFRSLPTRTRAAARGGKR